MNEKSTLNASKKDCRWTVKLGLLMLLVLAVCSPVFSQTTKTVKGNVFSDTDNSPLIGVTVVQTGTTNGTITDDNGYFELSVPENSSLTFTYVGSVPQTVKVGNKSDFQISLKENLSDLDEVVVMGYGVQKKKLITGATTQVRGDDIQKQNAINPLGALQGQTPGVSITQASGMPGEGYKVNIRGVGTNGDSEPLYVINGVVGGNINDLNPSDIESVDVLKDAASAAIYGSRAANGIILVTTKQGRSGKPIVTYDGYFGVQNVYRMPAMLNAQEYAMIQNEGAYNDGQNGFDFKTLVPNWDKIESGEWKGTNWMEEIRVKDAPIQNHAFNMTGGSDMSIYSTGLSYSAQEGIFGKPVSPSFDRYTFRINSEHSLLKKGNVDVIKIGENLAYSYNEKKGIGIGDVYWNDIRNMFETSPFLPNKNDGGGYHYAIPWNIYDANPIASMEYERGQNITKSKNLKGNIYAEIQPIKGLKYRVNFGYSNYTSSYRQFVPTFNLSFNKRNVESVTRQSIDDRNEISVDHTLNYIFKLAKEHSFDAMIGQSYEKMNFGEMIWGENANSMFYDFEHAYLSNSPKIVPGKTNLRGEPHKKFIIASFFGRVNYDYKQKYMASVIFRTDGSSNFAKGNRWGNFPSFSAGWVASSESFMASTKSWLDFLKVRASWGQNGNASIDPFQYSSTMKFANSQYFFGADKSKPTVGLIPTKIPNEKLKWETSEQINFGIDSRFLNSRLGVIFDIYQKTTKDWLVIVPTLGSYGASAPFVNGGDVRNRGLEFAFSWNDKIQDLNYGVNLNLATNTNIITRIANPEKVILGPKNLLGNGTGEPVILKEGFPMSSFWGYKTLGVFQNEEEIANYKGAKLDGTKPGDLIYLDDDGDGSITPADRKVLGDPNPDVNLGLTINLEYKGFDMSFTGNGFFGFQNIRGYHTAGNPKGNYTTEIFSRWHGEGSSNRIPRLTSGSHTNWTNISDIYVEDGDFFRIQNLSFGYDLTKSIKKLPFSQARIYVGARNLATMTGYKGMDPEVGSSGGATAPWVRGVDNGFYPAPRTFMVGVNLKF